MSDGLAKVLEGRNVLTHNGSIQAILWLSGTKAHMGVRRAQTFAFIALHCLMGLAIERTKTRILPFDMSFNMSSGSLYSLVLSWGIKNSPLSNGKSVEEGLQRRACILVWYVFKRAGCQWMLTSLCYQYPITRLFTRVDQDAVIMVVS